jgi:hypothetical protein
MKDSRIDNIVSTNFKTNDTIKNQSNTAMKNKFNNDESDPYFVLLFEKYKPMFGQIAHYMESRGLTKKYHFYKIEYRTILKLICYFAKDEEACAYFNLKLYKGICLIGNVGVGKTELLKALLTIYSIKHAFHNSEKIVSQFLESRDHSMINKWASTSKFNGTETKYRPCLYDDLGCENRILDFGNEINLMSQILNRRYDLSKRDPEILTFATTNLDTDELLQKYGSRTDSRFNEMFNFISFHNEAKDKRTL